MSLSNIVVCLTFGVVATVAAASTGWAQSNVTRTSNAARSEVEQLLAEGRAAAREGNCRRFRIRRDRLWDIRRNNNDRFWKNHDLDGPTAPGNIVSEVNGSLNTAIEILSKVECPQTTTTQPPRIEAQIAGGFGVVKLPRRGLLGFEIGGVPSIGLVTPDRDATGGGVSGSLRFNDPEFLANLAFLDALGFHEFVDNYLDFMFFYGGFEADDSFGAIDPGAGARLLIPGPTGGASGFSLGGNPLNVVRDARYSADLMKGGGAIRFGQRTAASNALSFGVFGSVGYARLSFDEMFSGSIPGFARSFIYDSSVDVDQARLRVGGEIRLRTRFVTDGGIEFRPEFTVSAEVGPDFSRGSGSDRLSFTGFPDSSIGISKSKTDFGFSTGLSVGLELSSGVKLGIEGRYIRETGLPVLVRDGTNPTRLELESGDAFIGMGRVTVPLGMVSVAGGTSSRKNMR